MIYFFFQAEDGIRYLVRSRGLGDVYKRRIRDRYGKKVDTSLCNKVTYSLPIPSNDKTYNSYFCLLYTSDAADERSSVDLGGRRIINKQNR